MILVSSSYQPNTGLNKGIKISKALKKIRIKDVSIKNAIKVTKGLAPIALSLIPVAGGTASKVGSKLLNSKLGKFATKISTSKVGTAVQKFAKTDLAKNAFANVKVSAINGGSDYADNGTDNSEPVGAVTPVKPVVTVSTEPAKKDNTMLYVGGAFALGAVAFFATIKK